LLYNPRVFTASLFSILGKGKRLLEICQSLSEEKAEEFMRALKSNVLFKD